MKTLLLLRHAKSSWDEELPDDKRPLAKRGREAAPQVGRYMAKKDLVPDLILCSTARRTTETLDLILPYFKKGIPIKYEDQLYLAEYPDLLARIRWVDDKVKTLLMIGHNPGLEQLAFTLAMAASGANEDDQMRRLAEKFPTGALAVLTFELKSWKNVKEGKGRLDDFVRPKDL
jgi:phosphohistidine phosphatase